MTTDKQIEAALLAFDPGFGPIDDAHRCMWNAKMRLALEAAERAAWEPIETAPKDGTEVIIADAFGVDVAAFDGVEPLEEFPWKRTIDGRVVRREEM